MTKEKIVAQVYNRLGLSKRECGDIVDLFFEIVKGTLSKGENVKLSGFGNFMVKQKRARRGRDPQTGGDIVIQERKVLTYKLSNVLKNEMNLISHH